MLRGAEVAFTGGKLGSEVTLATGAEDGAVVAETGAADEPLFSGCVVNDVLGLLVGAVVDSKGIEPLLSGMVV